MAVLLKKTALKFAIIINSNQKVCEITQLGTNGSKGASLKIVYNNDNTTTFTDIKNRKETYSFDNSGKIVSVLNTNGYVINSESSSSLSNASSGSESHTKNYVVNSNAESLTSYNKKGWNTNNSGTLALDNSKEKVDDENVQYLGKSSLRICQTNAADTTFYQTISASELAGNMVTFSSFIKLNGINLNPDNKGAFIRARYLNEQGSEISYEDSKVYSGDKKWKRVSCTFKVPQNTVTIEMHCGMKNAVGSAWFDCMQLENYDCMNDYNLLENSDFTGSGYWHGGTTIGGSATDLRSLPQDIAINKENVVFNIFGSAKGNSVPLRDNRTFGIMLEIKYANSTIPVEKHYQQFNEFTTAQQSVCLLINPERQDETIASVTYKFVYDYNAGFMNAYSGMLNVECLGASVSPNETDDSELPSGQTEEDIIDTQPYQGNVDISDNYGNTIESYYGTVLTDDGGNESIDKTIPYIKSCKGYDQTGNYVLSQTNERGITVYNDVNTNNGLIQSATRDDGNKTSFSYDPNTDNLLNASCTTDFGTVSNTYTYNLNKNIASVNRNGFSYHFNYDEYGNNTSVSIGDQPLFTNTVPSDGGNFTKSSFGNGNVLNYLYNSFGQLSEVKSGDNKVLSSYIYNKKGLISKIIDNDSNLVTEYQ